MARTGSVRHEQNVLSESVRPGTIPSPAAPRPQTQPRPQSRPPASPRSPDALVHCRRGELCAESGPVRRAACRMADSESPNSM